MDCNTPQDYFLTFFDSDIIENIVYQSNLYVTQKMKTNMKPITDQEFYSFAGINIIMGYHELPSWTDYWKHDPDLSVPFIANALPRNRFAQILSALHVNDNTAQPKNNTDKMYKLRPLLDSLNTNFMKLYNVSKRVSVDESMILFKGRSSIKQYNPMKPIKRGFKLWSLADMDGYLYKFNVYQGKNETETDPRMPNYFGLGDKVVYELTKSLYGGWHEVYFDNYFTSVPLAEFLLAHKVLCCGTIRKTKKYLPKDMTPDSKLKRGDFDYRVSKSGLTYYKWIDNKPVFLLSNFHGTLEDTVERTQKNGSSETISCPLAVKEYNSYMGGVDKADMLCAIYGISRKSKKWWHRIFFGSMDRSLCNAFVVYQKLVDPDIKLLDFRRLVAQGLLALGKPPKVGRPLSVSTPGPSKKRKSIQYSVPSSTRKENVGVHLPFYCDKRGRCEVCASEKVESRSNIKCSYCQVSLCLNKERNCFVMYHDVDIA